MIRVLSDPDLRDEKRYPLQILDLRGASFEEAEAELEALHEDTVDLERWKLPRKKPIAEGIRIIIDWVGSEEGAKGRHPLEREDGYALHPKYGFEVLWACTIRERGMMYVVAPVKKPKPGLLYLLEGFR